MGIPDYLTCFLRRLCAGKEARVGTILGTREWFNIGKGGCQDCILSPCFFNFYAEYIMPNARLNHSQVESRLLGEISASDMQMIPLLQQKTKRNLKASWWGWKRRVKKLASNSSFKKLMASCSITLWQIDRGKVEPVTHFIFLGSKISAANNYSHKIGSHLLLGRKALAKLDSI